MTDIKKKKITAEGEKNIVFEKLQKHSMITRYRFSITLLLTTTYTFFILTRTLKTARKSHNQF